MPYSNTEHLVNTTEEISADSGSAVFCKNEPRFGVICKSGLYSAVRERSLLIHNRSSMTQNLNTRSVTIDKLVVPSSRPTEIQGLGLEGMRFERIGVDRTRRGDR